MRHWNRSFLLRRSLERADVLRSRAFRALLHVEFDRLSFFQGPEALHADFCLMAKQILPAVIRRDESVTLGLIEPLNFALHVLPFALENYPHSSVNRKLPLPTGKARR